MKIAMWIISSYLFSMKLTVLKKKTFNMNQLYFGIWNFDLYQFFSW